jgi:PAT family beta-lactamase induction signal transducer AmpG
MSLPVLYMMSALAQHQWIMPITAAEKATRIAAPALVTALWVATLLYAVAQGLMYGTCAAIFMDVTNPKVAATQFTAYMALSNLAISYSATWQGIAAEALGYPKTLLIDAVTGLLCLAVLPFIKSSTKSANDAEGDGGGAGRARMLATMLALGCLMYLPYRAGVWSVGPAGPIFETLFTLIFVASAVFLGAGAAALGGISPRLVRLSYLLAPLLLAMYVRNWWPQLGPAYYVVPALGALLLAVLARQRWQVLRPATTVAAGL